MDGVTTVARKQAVFHCCLRDAVLLQEGALTPPDGFKHVDFKMLQM